MNNGTSSEDEFVRRMEARPMKTKVFRNRDKKDLMGLNKGKKVGAFPLPSDFLVAEPGRVFFAEVKSLEDKERFDYANIRPGQRSAASMCAAVGAPYYFFIHHLATSQWFQLTGDQFYADVKAGKKSRKLEELEHYDF